MKQKINLKSFKDFVESGLAGGVFLLCCVLISFGIANSALGDNFERLLTTEIGFSNATVELKYSILSWINDGLMAIFFLMVGLEIKRELVEGELSSPAKATLPILAACGGAILPALIFAIINSGTETSVGWGIPMATDIAFALAIITVLGKKAPPALKVFLAALAIADDLLAILVIAIFYTTELHLLYLTYAAALLVLLIIFNRLRVKKLVFYIIPGLLIWYFVHHSGIHATIAGVLVALTLPTTPDATESPLEKLERLLLNPVNFIIIPLFALVNTNIKLEYEMLSGLGTPLGLGILIGLVVGKPIGIFLTSKIAVKLGIAELPDNTNWWHILGAGMLGGIGFTMSIFISILSFSGMHHNLMESKFSILLASLLSAIIGSTSLIQIHKRQIHDKL